MILYRWQISRLIIDGIDLTRVHFFRSEWWFGLLTITNYLQSQMRDSKHLHRRRIHILVKSQRELIWQELTLSRIMVHLQSGSGLDNYIHKYKLFTISNERLHSKHLHWRLNVQISWQITALGGIIWQESVVRKIVEQVCKTGKCLFY